MSFGQYALKYSEYLNHDGILQLAVASVIFNLAQGRLPVFYCVDPYIPGYGDPREFCSHIPYDQRSWLSDLRAEGCHRVILAEEIVKVLLRYVNHVTVLEVDPTFEKTHCRCVSAS